MLLLTESFTIIWKNNFKGWNYEKCYFNYFYL